MMASDDLTPAFATLQLRSHHDDQRTEVFHTSGSTFLTGLPLEIILRILYYVGPRDLIRLRAVCNRLHDIIDDPSVWKAAYTNSRLPLPPGPFPWQSNRTLQRAMIESDRLGQTWTSQPLTFISKFASDSVTTGPTSQDKDRFVWIRGRWLLLTRQMKQLVCHDVETNCQQILWKGDRISQWAACSVISARGHSIYVAMRMGPRCRLQDPVRLLEFEVEDDTGRLTGPVTYNVPTPTLRSELFEPRLRLESEHSSLVEILVSPSQDPRQTLVFDSQTRRFYKFPPFRTQLDDILNYMGPWLPHLVEMYLTTTHIFVLSRSWLIRGNPGMVEVMQTFAIPDDADAPLDEFGVRELRLTHEYLIRDRSQMSMAMALIRNSVIDPVKKTTTVRYIHTFMPLWESEVATRFVCTDYILPETSNKDIGPIIIESHEVFRLDGVWHSNFMEASDEGRVRGMTLMGQRHNGENIPRDVIYKYEVDATGERCMAVIGDPSPQMPGIELSTSFEYSLDGFRGKFWFTRGNNRQRNAAGNVVAYVVDFK